MSFFFNDTATPSIYTLSLHDALPILRHGRRMQTGGNRPRNVRDVGKHPRADTARNLTDACEVDRAWIRSEEHTSELQSRLHLVCRLLLEKKKHNRNTG